jgi:hypothetical protein
MPLKYIIYNNIVYKINTKNVILINNTNKINPT